MATIPASLAERIFAGVFNELPLPAAPRAIDLINRAQGSGQVPRFRNRGLVSTHYLTQVIRREARPEWAEAADGGDRALGQVGEALIRALGIALRRPAEDRRIEADGIDLRPRRRRASEVEALLTQSRAPSLAQ